MKIRTLVLPEVGVEAERSYNPENLNSITYTYYYNDTICPHLIIDSPAAQKIASYHLINKDLNFVESIIKLILHTLSDSSNVPESCGFDGHDNSDYVTLKALHQSAVIAYGKCFANSTGGKGLENGEQPRGVKLDVATFIQVLPQHQQDLHAELIHHRNEYVAHGGATSLEQAFSVFIFAPNNEFNIHMITQETHAGAMSPDFYDEALDLVKTLKEILSAKQKKQPTHYIIEKSQL